MATPPPHTMMRERDTEAHLRHAIKCLKRENEALRKRIAELEERKG